MKVQQGFRMFRRLAMVGALLFIMAIAASGAPENPFEMNVTNDLTISSGEPQIAADPTKSKNVAIVEFASGSKEAPAYTFVAGNIEDFKDAIMTHTGRVMLSTDGGDH